MININIEKFLVEYWQKKPLVIRRAFPDYQSPVTAEVLAGLACEDFIESRIISQHKVKPTWQLESGPFDEIRFSQLPDTHWTLLIQGINKYFPDIDDLLRQFNFIPSWRLDDVMASYASPHGSVGPHIDQYDVFLLQISGQRKWMLSEQVISDEDFETDSALKIIKNFIPESEWLLEPGDMLYLPPNIAHFGIAMDACITFSIGFRAPSHAELLSSFIDEHILDLNDTLRYLDPDLSKEKKCGEISTFAIQQIQELLISHFRDTSKIEDWFGRFITGYLSDAEIITEDRLNVSEFMQEFESTGTLRRPAVVRASYLTNQQGRLSLYINGNRFKIKPELDDLVMFFCNQHKFTYHELKPFLNNNEGMIFLCELYNSGYLEIVDVN